MAIETIRTERLRLVAADAPLARAAADGGPRFSELLGAPVPPSWPPEDLADALGFIANQLETDPGAAAWSMWFILVDAPLPAKRLLIGGAGFKGGPRADGSVEVGYAIIPDQQRRGYAAEAVRGLVRWAFSHPEVRRVLAHTFERHEASVGVLRKNGFIVAGPGTEAVDENDRRGRGELLLYQLRRADWERSPAAPPTGPRVVALHHARITVPREQERRAREFYCGVLGLREIAGPDDVPGRAGFWVAAGDRAVHIGLREEAGHVRLASPHLAYAVTGLAHWRERLAAAGVTPLDSVSVPGMQRLEFIDPFGNRVELIETF